MIFNVHRYFETIYYNINMSLTFIILFSCDLITIISNIIIILFSCDLIKISNNVYNIIFLADLIKISNQYFRK